MLIKKNISQLVFFLILFWLYLFGSLIQKNVLLTDDLAIVNNAILTNHENFLDYIYNFINTETMTSRPVSAIFTAILSYATSFLESFYYLGYIFFLVSVFFVFKTIQIFTKNNFISISGVFLYAFCPIGNSIVFSPLMLNSALATIFYCCSLIFLIKEQKNRYNTLLSAIFFLLSIFSYEIFLPLLFSNFLLLKKRKIAYIASILITFLLYKKIIEPFLFTNYYQREQLHIALNFKRDFIILLKFIKVFVFDLFISLIKALNAIRYYSIKDFIMLFSLSISFIIFASKNKFDNNFIGKNTKLFQFLIFSLLLSFTIFFASDYEPSIKGFSSRTLGGIRLYISFILMYLFIKYRLKVLFIVTIIISIINSISVKNAWEYSYEVNNEIFSEISEKKISARNAKQLYIVFNKDNINLKQKFALKQKEDRNYFFNRNNFIANEPMYYSPWESEYYKHKFNLDKKINIEYYFYNEKVKAKPYYLFDFQSKKIFLIKE